jgi:hypothetical protein
VITELWPRLEDHKYRWELSDIIVLLIEALKASASPITVSLARTSRPRATIQPAPPPDQTPPHSAVSDCPIGCVKGVFDATTLMASPPLTHPMVSA